ncbi:NIL domain-containing protein [Sediminispirochaeta smaragdinae]|uniref:NIL domain protein n=1 Tax=Sediminispirochaeta smaragdinae (strain DSM 11293 / JCM 15392 / SEBR 4228) TaxID=573413 RepID=E1R413_SEDSS|nr:NIL domain-containing protein [Sediminispirochaeta smaragdinae]ADK80435.1 NIL domain protein [Sediminispirochaeta smaragdinae DSM 11293]
MIQKKFLLNFSKEVSEQPHIYHLVKDYDLIVNIFRAKITDEAEGFMILEISGEKDALRKGIAYLRDQNVGVGEAEKGVVWDEERCTQCGNCLSHCPTHALRIDNPATMHIIFDAEACIECLACIKNCPYGACTSVF